MSRLACLGNGRRVLVRNRPSRRPRPTANVRTRALEAPRDPPRPGSDLVEAVGQELLALAVGVPVEPGPSCRPRLPGATAATRSAEREAPLDPGRVHRRQDELQFADPPLRAVVQEGSAVGEDRRACGQEFCGRTGRGWLLCPTVSVRS
jgi:hypothetical protein